MSDTHPPRDDSPDDARGTDASADPREQTTDASTPTMSEAVGSALAGAARRAGLDPTREASTGHVVWRAMGGWRGLLEAVLPGLIFVVVYTVTIDPRTQEGNLWLSLGLSVGVAAVFTIVRFAMRQPPSAAIAGLLAAGVAAALALWTGRGEDNFIPGFITNAVYGSVLLVSALIGWSLIGLAIGFLMGEGTAWRRNARKRRAFFWLTIAWAALFAARLAVQLPLYFAADVTALGTFKLVMGLPLFAPLLAVTWLVVRALYPPAGAPQTSTR